jgi:hypothetical protein
MLPTEPYEAQLARWPSSGRHILAHFDADSIVVYQAYRPDIGVPAARDGRFPAAWSRSRMSWVKPNFLWMMYRCGWADKPGQEVVLAIRMRRGGFDEILASAIHSGFKPGVYASREEWAERVARSDVRLQWDPDHDPYGRAVERRAIQLGLRHRALARYADEWILEIADITPFVREQREHLARRKLPGLLVPREDVYPVSDPSVAARLGIASLPAIP